MENYSKVRNKKVLRKNVAKKIAIGALAFSIGAVGRLAYDMTAEPVQANAVDNIVDMGDTLTDTFDYSDTIEYVAETAECAAYDAAPPEMIEAVYDIQKDQPEQRAVGVYNLSVSPVSVSCLKVSWAAEPNRSYQAKVSTDAPYSENIRFVYKETGTVYLTGLRENSEYAIEVIPINLRENEAAVPETIVGRTDHVLPLIEYGKEEGWTGCFAYEKASGLTRMPSSGAIYGTVTDPITDTGIRRNKYGDYCCAMGLWYGRVGDRFLVELENGIQFTVQICDSKGWGDDADGDGVCDGRFHWFGYKDGKCVIEFIYNDGSLPNCVHKSGSYGYWNWGGLNLGSNIEKIQMISKEGNEVEY